MKQLPMRLCALGLSAALVAGSLGLTLRVCAADQTQGAADETAQEPAQQTTQTEKESTVTAAAQAGKDSKDETVYVFTAADGSTENVIVSDWLQNTSKSQTLTDVSSLTDIENVKGDETYQESGETKTWQANGNDIYYQGETTKEPPVRLQVHYKLDGKDISASELAGKSGHVTIRFDYENTEYAMKEIDGAQEKVYVPFVAVTGLLLDGEKFTNVEVTNGKNINDGSRNVVAGLAFPGLAQNLQLDAQEFDLPDYLEVEADVTEFELENTVTLVTNSVFDSLDDVSFDSLDDLSDAMGKLTDAMTQLLDGSTQLYDGLETLLEKSGALVDGVNQLSNGLGTLTANNDTLNGGAKQVFDTLLAAANEQIKSAGLTVETLTIDNYETVLDGAIAQISSMGSSATGTAREKVTQMVRAQEPTIRAGVTQAVQEQVTKQVTASVRDGVWLQVLAAAGIGSQEEYEAGIAAGVITEEQQQALSAALEAQMVSESVQSMIASNVSQQMEAQQSTIDAKTEEQIQTLINQYMASSDVQAEIAAGAAQAAAGAASLQKLKEQLNSYNTFYTGLLAYTSGVASARNGAAKLQSSLPALTDGITQLRDGAKQLVDGLQTFDEEGIKKLTDALDGDVEGLLDRFQAMVEVSKDYRSFSGISDQMDGQVKFIYRTDAIEMQ